jgi:hypothetical protein
MPQDVPAREDGFAYALDLERLPPGLTRPARSSLEFDESGRPPVGCTAVSSSSSSAADAAACRFAMGAASLAPPRPEPGAIGRALRGAVVTFTARGK